MAKTGQNPNFFLVPLLEEAMSDRMNHGKLEVEPLQKLRKQKKSIRLRILL